MYTKVELNVDESVQLNYLEKKNQFPGPAVMDWISSLLEKGD